MLNRLSETSQNQSHMEALKPERGCNIQGELPTIQIWGPAHETPYPGGVASHQGAKIPEGEDYDQKSQCKKYYHMKWFQMSNIYCKKGWREAFQNINLIKSPQGCGIL